MRRKFRTKKSMNLKSKWASITFITIFIYLISIVILSSKNMINFDNQTILSYVFHQNDDFNIKDISSINFLYSYAFGSNYANSSPVFESNNDNQSIETPVYSEEKTLIYIYNSHPTEAYSYESFELFNITPTIVTASHILKEYLENEYIDVIVESRSAADIVIANDWAYSSSYRASKLLMEDAKEKYPEIDMYIDLHRDSSSKTLTTTKINNKSCSKFLFVIGLEHESFEQNLSFANLLNEKLKEIDPSLSRGISKKSGEGVNGVYNQDFHPETLLIEVGGQYSTIDEVSCSLLYLAEAIQSLERDYYGN